jgi:hypothetical protein
VDLFIQGCIHRSKLLPSVVRVKIQASIRNFLNTT